MGLFKDYFELVDYYNNKYDKCIVFIQNGAFFEMYGLKSGDVIVNNSHAFDVAKLCGLKLAKKSSVSMFKDNDLYQIGFRDYMIEKYINIVISRGYTCVVYKQDTNSTGTTRSLMGIYSSGTVLNEEHKISNNIVCITFNVQRNLLKKHTYIHIGLSSVDILSGKVYMCEYSKQFIHDTTTYDDVERFISIVEPCEIICIYTPQITDDELSEILKFCSIHERIKIHKIKKNDYNNKHKTYNFSKYLNIHDTLTNYQEAYELCGKQEYQQEMIYKYFKHLFTDIDMFMTQIHIYDMPIACQSLFFLLEFIYSQNPSVVDTLQEPQLFQETETMLLANHSLRQLNIIDDGYILTEAQKSLTSSVAKFVNRCCTTMGRRYVYHKLLHPNTNIQYLSKEYTYMSKLEKTLDISSIRRVLNSCSDFELIYRKLHLNKLTLQDIKLIYDSCLYVPDIIEHVNTIETYFSYNFDFYKKMSTEMIDFINTHFDKMNIDKDFFLNTETYNELYERSNQLSSLSTKIHDIVEYINKLLSQDTKYKEQCYFDNQCIKMTKRRFDKLKTLIPSNVKFDGWCWDTREITGVPLSKVSKDVKLYNSELETFITEYNSGRREIDYEIKEIYSTILDKLKLYQYNFYMISSFITQVDFLQNRIYLSKKYNYVCPEIDVEQSSSCVYAKDMRHILIEHIQDKEPYIPNTLYLGYSDENDDVNSILLFGTNASGKSSLIKSLGICVILAQSGFYVPCSSFKFYPYRSLFTRILGNDNIFKSLSTYAVEMSEFRTILKYADNYSLILGDELCSGTEIGSALSIFSAGLINLHERGSHSIFATHFHQLTEMSWIKSLVKLRFKHLAVHIDGENMLLYDRNLRDGPGNNMYGILVCKSLGLPEDFLKLANDIRHRLYPSDTGIIQSKSSKYNSKKLKGNCEMCGTRASEIHHLQFQSCADDKGFINSFYKNHKSNLMSICNKCHQSLHDTPLKRCKSSNGYILKKIT